MPATVGGAAGAFCSPALTSLTNLEFADRLRLARLAAIYFCERAAWQKTCLSSPLAQRQTTQDKFKGRRRKVAMNVEPYLIELEGDCRSDP